ncbi:hypothetical protein GBA52_008555, partial [Prunus armeniaca]
MSHGAWNLKYSVRCKESSSQFFAISMMLVGKLSTESSAKFRTSFWLLEAIES